jgi:hypothetical protein
MPLLLGILTLAILLVIGMRLAERLGYPFWYGLALGVPIVNLFVLAFFAFNRSPREERIVELEAEIARLRRGPPPALRHDPD